jgi:hypothetical protein
MATKLTVALVGGIVIVVSIAILIIVTLTSPSRCMPRGETSQTEENLLHKTEPVSSPSTILSPRTNFPPHSTNLPSLGDKFVKNSTPHPDTVLSTVNAVDEEVTSPTAEEEASDRQPRDDGTVTVTLPANISTTIDSRTRNIIIVPPRNCPSGQKRDTFGVCRHKW